MITHMCLKNNFTKILGFLTNRPLVVLVDFDREKTLRLGKYTDDGFFAMRWALVKVRLMPNNKTRGASFVSSWYYYKGGKC